MTLRECYQELSGDYDEVLDRLIKPERIEKYMLKFLEDPSYEELCAAYSGKKYKEAFRAVHTLKGVSQNLGFLALFRPCSILTEILRDNRTPADESLMHEITEAYGKTIGVIKKYQETR